MRPLAPIPLLVLAMAAACSDYDLHSDGTPPLPPEDDDATQTADDDTTPPADDDTTPPADDDTTPPAEEVCNGVDDDGDGLVDEGFDTNGNGIADCRETEVLCTPFDDFDGWSYTGDGAWHVDGGVLVEGRNGLYAGVAYAADLGLAEHFYIEVDVAWGGNMNDLSGIAWGVSGDTWFAARWDDPQGDYGRHDPPGAIDVSWCQERDCTQYAQQSSVETYHAADLSFVRLAVSVDGDDVAVLVGGVPVLVATVPEVVGSGPGVVGVYSDDNDGGVYFDNFCVLVED